MDLELKDVECPGLSTPLSSTFIRCINDDDVSADEMMDIFESDGKMKKQRRTDESWQVSSL